MPLLQYSSNISPTASLSIDILSDAPSLCFHYIIFIYLRRDALLKIFAALSASAILSVPRSKKVNTLIIIK